MTGEAVETGRLGPLDERFQRWSEEDAEPERLWWRVAIHEPGGHTVPWQEDRDRLSEVRASRPG